MTAERRPADSLARAAVVGDLDATMFVEAGAGSGKTSALVARIVELVRSGRTELRGVVAITFTESAAAELRLRIRQELTKQAAANPGEQTLRDATAQVDEAAIGTIHGFCRRILAEHPLEARLPPGFVVLDEVRASIEWRRTWSETFDRLTSVPGTSDLVGLARLLGIPFDALETIARTLDDTYEPVEARSSSPTGDGVPLTSSPGAILSEIHALSTEGCCQLVSKLEEASSLRIGCRTPDALLARLDLLDAARAQLVMASANERGLDALVRFPENLLHAGRCGNAENWDKGVARQIRQLLLDGSETAKETIAAAADLVLRHLVHELVSLGRDSADLRRERGELSFHDLLVRTRELVSANPKVAAALRARFKVILVDEFQDTDSLQLEIVELLARDVDSRGVEMAERGRAFFVGDPKQAIYRFRGADLGTYLDARERVAGGRPTALTTNFRSVPGIVAYVNAGFEVLFDGDYSPLVAWRGALGEEPPVRLAGGPLDQMNAGERRHREAVSIAHAIESATRAPGWMVADELAPGGQRPAQLGDVAVLVPRRTGLEVLEGVLDEREIAYRVESASLLYGSQEVRDLVALGRVLEEPGNELALVATLRSPAYACGDDDLLEYHLLGGLWSLEAGIPEVATTSPVGRAMADLARLRGALREIGPIRTLASAMDERRTMLLAGSTSRATESWRRLRYVLDQARGFVEAGGGGLSSFADWIDEQLVANVRMVESTVAGDDDAVRILTIHGAKGLEFPVTILAGLGSSRPGSPRAATVLRKATGEIEVRVRRGIETRGFEDLARIETALEAAEHLRLLYVGATRARDHLVICTHHVPGTTGTASLAEQIHAASCSVPELWSELGGDRADGRSDETLPKAETRPNEETGIAVGATPSRSPVRSHASAPPSSVPGGTEDDYRSWLAERSRMLARAERPASVAATKIPSLPRAGGSETGAERAASDDELPEWRHGRAGTEVGRAVHAVLQSVDLATFASPGPDSGAIASLAALSVAQASAERVPDRAREVERLARAALASPVVVSAIASRSARREIFVAVPVGDVLLEGFVDLCFDDGAGLVVVDYKTDSVLSPESVDEAYERYRLQAAAYALALGDATGRLVSRCVLVFLSPPGAAIEREVTPLADLVDEVRQIVSSA